MNDSVGQRLVEKSRPVEFKKSLGLFGATSLGVGALMGAGLYVLVGIAAEEAGPGLFAAYAACGLLTLFSVGMYAELARQLPVSGGGYLYAYNRLGSFWGFLVGWHLALGSIFACALYAYGFGSYLLPFFRFGTSGNDDRVIRGIAVGLVALLAALALRGGKGGSRLQTVFTWGNVAVILFLVVIALFSVEGERYTPLFPNGVGGVGGAVSLVYLSFFGYQLIANAAEEVVTPEKTVPRAMWISLFTAFALYLAVAVVAVGAVHWTELTRSSAPLVLVATRAIGPAGGIVIGAGALLASLAALNGTLVSQARQIYAMGRDRFVPPALGNLTEKTRVPSLAILTGGLVTVVVLLFADLAFIAKAANFSLLFSMLPLSFALHRMNQDRHRKGETIRLVKRALPFCALLANAGLLLTLDYESLMFGGTVVAAGCVIFFGYSYSSEKRGQAGFSVRLDDDKAFHFLGRGERILVPMANPRTLPLLLRLGERFLPSDKGEILVLNIVTMREGQKPREALSRQSQVSSAVDVLTLADEVAKQNQVAFTPIVRAARSLSEGIVHAAMEERAGLVVMGWSENDEALASDLLNSVAESWRGNLLFFHHREENGGTADMRYRRVGVALGGPGNLSLMTRVANALAAEGDGRVIYFNVLSSYYDAEEMNRAREIQMQVIHKHNSLLPYFTELHSSDNPFETIVNRSEALDLLVIGTNKAGLFSKTRIGSFTSMVARDARCPVIVVRQESSLTSFIPPPVEGLR